MFSPRGEGYTPDRRKAPWPWHPGERVGRAPLSSWGTHPQAGIDRENGGPGAPPDPAVGSGGEHRKASQLSNLAGELSRFSGIFECVLPRLATSPVFLLGPSPWVLLCLPQTQVGMRVAPSPPPRNVGPDSPSIPGHEPVAVRGRQRDGNRSPTKSGNGTLNPKFGLT